MSWPSPSSDACAATRSSSSRSTASPARSPISGRGACRRRNCSASTTRPTRVTIEQIGAASKKYVQPAQASLLLVGDRAKIEAKVKALNLGEIVLLDNEGKPVAATGTK